MGEGKKKRRTRVGFLLGSILIMASFAILLATLWAKKQFSELDFSALIFHLKVPLAGSNNDTFAGIAKQCAMLAPVAALLVYCITGMWDSEKYLELRVWKKTFCIPFGRYRKHYIKYSAGLLVASLAFSVWDFQVPAYVKSQLTSSSLFEDHYVDPRNATITFPEKKRNLIYIFMESMENTYMSEEVGGAEEKNYIPAMTELQTDHVNFNSDGSINGGIAAYGSTWTMGAMVAQTAGIPLNIPIGGNAMEDGYTSFLPGACSIGEVLEEEGYQQVFLLGSNALFGGRETYMTQHGNYAIEDYDYAVEQGWIPKDYYVWWGYEDEILYQNAKTELTRLSSQKEPFNLTMLTVDTHFIGGYQCNLCTNDFGEDTYANAIACASRQVTDFVEWIQAQDFYENTTIVISGDHPTMDDDYIDLSTGGLPDGYQRKVYTTVINPARDYTLDQDRIFTTMDLYPTTLSSLGADIEGHRLGLGTDLFSETPTLAEELGVEELDRELAMNSKYYNNDLLYQ